MAVYRAYLQLFAVRVRESATRVGELRPSLTQFGVEISTGDAKRRLESVDYAELVWVQSLLSEIQDRTFQEMMSEFKLQTGCSLEQFREEVKTLGLAHELVIHPRIDDVKFYVSTCNPQSRMTTGASCWRMRSRLSSLTGHVRVREFDTPT
jgi:hypothetical protein